MKIKIIITTTDSKAIADKIAKNLVENNFSPCVQVIDNVSSTYKWGNKLLKEMELLLLIKTSINNLDNCKRSIKKIHNYDAPELITIESNIIEKKYEKWFKKLNF